MDENDKNLRLMNEILKKRGPDEEGYYNHKGFYLGSRRLSIIDLSSGRMPIFNEDKSIAIVFNGEIYNYLSLKNKLLKKHKFYTKSDTEVIVHLYEEFGFDCLKYLDGMFAFCLYDKKRNLFFGARDRVGEKPFYYYQKNNNFIFSSELSSLLMHNLVPKNIDLQSSQKYFFYGFVPAPFSMIENVKKVPPGSYFVFSPVLGLKISQYWNFDYEKKELNTDLILKKTEDILIKSVKERLYADVPLGIFLSGGIDSGLITAIASNILDTKKINTFTIGFKENNFDETIDAAAVSRKYKTAHHVKIFTSAELFNCADDIYKYLDEPISDSSLLPTYLLSKFAKGYVKVVLSGDGGDELFGGYPKYNYHTLADVYRKIPETIRTNLLEKLFVSVGEGAFDNKTRKFLSGIGLNEELRNQIWISANSLDDIKKIFKSVISEKILYEDIYFYLKMFRGNKLLDKMFYLDSKLILANAYLTKIDRASMANSLEVRCPFFAKELLEMSSSIDPSEKISFFQTKKILRTIALKYLPKEIVYKRKKGFGVPISLWLRDEKIYNKVYNLIKNTEIDFIDNKYILALVKEHKNRTADYSGQIWNAYVYCCWFNNNFVK